MDHRNYTMDGAALGPRSKGIDCAKKTSNEYGKKEARIRRRKALQLNSTSSNTTSFSSILPLLLLHLSIFFAKFSSVYV